MKKFLLVAILAIVVCQSSLFAQPKAMLGFKYGMVNSKFDAKDLKTITDVEDLKGINAGVFFNFSGKFIGVQPEMIFTQKGSSYSLSVDSVNFKLSYLEVPVLLKVYAPLPIVKPNIFAGPYASFRFAQEVTVGETKLSEVEENIVDYGVVFGGGVDIHPTRNLVISGDVRYDYGLSDISDNDGVSLEANNRSLIYNVGIGFRF